MVHPAGFEPATSWFEAKHSIQMSYGCIFTCKYWVIIALVSYLGKCRGCPSPLWRGASSTLYTVYMLYLLYGQDDYSRGLYLQGLVKRTGLVRVDFGLDNLPKDSDELLSQDLFSGGQVVVLDNIADKFLTEENIELFAVSNNHIVFVESKLDQRTSLTKKLLADKRIQTKEFSLPAPEQLPTWIASYVKERGGNIDAKTARFLCVQLGVLDPLGGMLLATREVSLAQVIQELKKLLAYSLSEPITESAVRELVADNRQVISLSIANSITRKNRAELFSLLSRYYEGGGSEDEISKTLALIGLLSDQFRSQLLVQDAVSSGVNDQEIIAKTGWKPSRLAVLKRASTHVSTKALKDTLGKLENLDMELKSSTVPARVILELILAQVV